MDLFHIVSCLFWHAAQVITSPNSASVWPRGSVQTISWTRALAPSLPVTILLATRFGYQYDAAIRLQSVLTIATAIDANSFDWSIPETVTPDNLYAVVVRQANDSSIVSWSTFYLTISIPASSSLCAPVVCSNGGSCNATSGLCTCANGFVGLQCEYPASSVVAGYSMTADSTIRTDDITVQVYSPVTLEECAQLCTSNNSCASFDFGESWTLMQGVCTLSNWTRTTAGTFNPDGQPTASMLPSLYFGFAFFQPFSPCS